MISVKIMLHLKKKNLQKYEVRQACRTQIKRARTDCSQEKAEFHDAAHKMNQKCRGHCSELAHQSPLPQESGGVTGRPRSWIRAH